MPTTRSTRSETTAAERHEMINTIISSHVGKGRKKPTLITDNGPSYRYLIAETPSHQGIFLVPSDLTEEVYEAIVEEAEMAGLGDHYHVYCHRSLIFSDDVTWYPLPSCIR